MTYGGQNETKPILYIAVDVETDGPIPGTYSMLSLGMHAVGINQSFYQEIQPISTRYDPEALAVSGLDREFLMENGASAQKTMIRSQQWIDSFKSSYNPVMIANPAAFDGMFIHWYFIRMIGENPFSVNGRCIDLRSYYMGKFGTSWEDSSLRKIKERHDIVDVDHTHNALDDAKELAIVWETLFMN